MKVMTSFSQNKIDNALITTLRKKEKSQKPT